MTNEIIKVKRVKSVQEKLQKFYLQVLTDSCVRIAILEICSEKKTRESAVGTFKNICTKKLSQKSIFPKMPSEVLKSSKKMISAGIKTGVKQEIKNW